MSRKKVQEQQDVAFQQFYKGRELAANHPMFAPLCRHASIVRLAEDKFPADGWAYVHKDGTIHVHPKRRGAPEQWLYVLAHCLLHLGLGHFESENQGDSLWNAACDCAVDQFLRDLKLGTPPPELPPSLPETCRDERRLYAKLRQTDPKPYFGYGVMGVQCDMRWEATPWGRWKTPIWRELFAQGLQSAIAGAVDVAAGKAQSIYGGVRKTLAQLTKEWFISSYPLLGAIAAGYRLIEDPAASQGLQISIAAVCPELQEIYINPAAGLNSDEMRFVMAHEFLHAALRHDARCQGRDPELWNVACDYVINSWLRDMRLGEMPYGCLYDEQFKGLSAESIYDRITTDLRLYRKLATLRGVGMGDILTNGTWWERGSGVDLDGFYRDALAQGLEYHTAQNRGTLPSNLVEEIRALSHPPISWDVELARWFDEQFQPLEKTRTYARISRRQSSTPDIPRPAWRIEEAARAGRTYGVLLDTSGSMSRSLLAKALGAVASYSVSREVSAVRVVFCDAAAYDQGYLRPEDIADTVRVRGRGGTILQPGIDLLDADQDFPKNAPLLIITDGDCDSIFLRGREHAFLIPQGATLPFVPKGKIFRMKQD